MMTAKDIQNKILHKFIEAQNPFGCLNFSGAGFKEMDVIIISKKGLVTEFEVKVSRKDFFRDFNKATKHQALCNGDNDQFHRCPNRFFYAVPENLVHVNEVPSYAGLLYFHEDPIPLQMNVVKPAPLIHRIKPGPELIQKLCSLYSQRAAFGMAYMTYHNKKIRGRI